MMGAKLREAEALASTMNRATNQRNFPFQKPVKILLCDKCATRNNMEFASRGWSKACLLGEMSAHLLADVQACLLARLHASLTHRLGESPRSLNEFYPPCWPCSKGNQGAGVGRQPVAIY